MNLIQFSEQRMKADVSSHFNCFVLSCFPQFVMFDFYFHPTVLKQPVRS